MVRINYNNTELESLFKQGKSVTFKTVVNKTTFMQAIYSFKSLLSVINNVIELKPYRCLNYQKRQSFSVVTIKGSGFKGSLVFSEEDNGSCITLYELNLN